MQLSKKGLLMFSKKVCVLLLIINAQMSANTSNEEFFARTLQRSLEKQHNLPESLFHKTLALADSSEMISYYTPSVAIHHALFRAYPSLHEKLPVVTFAQLPTPVQKLSALSSLVGIDQLYIKRDDMTGIKTDGSSPLFGGNKLRKLEFLFGDALLHGATSVMTFGCAGSNHVVATAACARHIGLPCITMLKPQLNSEIVKRNLLLMDYYGADIHYCMDGEIRSLGALYTFLKCKSDNGKYPYVIPTGGSCPMGIIGYVNAAFELKEQINNGVLPEPDRIYVAVGSCGTFVGLLLGACAAGLKSKIIGVAVERGEFKDTVMQLFYKTNQLLRAFDIAFPQCNLAEEYITILLNHAGQEYGKFTQDGVEAIKLVRTLQGITLDGTYTGKAFAGMLADIEGLSKDTVVLFWNTFYGDDCAFATKNVNVENLPQGIQRYFQEPVQSLDCVQ